MTDFKAKMHQIRFWLGLCPRPRWGSLQRSPRPSSLIWGAASRQGEGLGWGGAAVGKRRERGVEGRERERPQVTVEPGPLRALLRHWRIHWRAIWLRQLTVLFWAPLFIPKTGKYRHSSSKANRERERERESDAAVVARFKTDAGSSHAMWHGLLDANTTCVRSVVRCR